MREPNESRLSCLILDWRKIDVYLDEPGWDSWEQLDHHGFGGAREEKLKHIALATCCQAVEYVRVASPRAKYAKPGA